VFQVGPLPVYVDAAFQSVFGEKYAASLYAALFIKILRITAVWMVVRRVASGRTAAALAVFCALDPLFSFAHHWSTAYAQLFMTASGLCFLLASRADGRKTLVYLGLAGLSAALIVSARQSTAVMVAVVLFAATAVMTARKEFFTPRRFFALWGGFAAGFVLVFGALALAGALGPAIQQMFLDAPAKKAVHGLDAVLDAISGGALVDASHSWWGGFLFFLGLPSVVVASSVYVLSRDDADVTAGSVGVMIVPIAVLVGLLTRYASLAFFSDLPRTFLTVTTAIAVLFPTRMRRWFGLEPIVAIGLGALPLASDWALEMSYPGRGWGDATSLVTGVVLFALASTRLGVRAKTALCGGLALAAVVHFALFLSLDRNPYAKDTVGDLTLTENHLRWRDPLLRGSLLDDGRKKTLEWLAWQVPPNSTCFIYANLPVLYTLLHCKNPTRIDSTAADFITAADAERAIEALRTNPPEFLIAHEQSWMSPPLSLDLEGKVERYDSINPKASMALHVGLRSLLPRYESLGLVSDFLGPELTRRSSTQWDVIGATRLYRRKP
jgi:hypothetical protein